MSDNLHDQLNRLVSGYWYTQTIYVAAKLGIADLLKDGPKPVKELAEATGTEPRALHRLLRALASIGLFAEREGRFALTPLAECLLDPATKAMATMRGEFQYRAWGELLYSVQTGKSAFGKPIFDYFSENPETSKIFDQAMTGVHGRETDAMLEAYDFTNIKTVADIGGGNGSVITAVLKKYPAMHGILADRLFVSRVLAEVLMTYRRPLREPGRTCGLLASTDAARSWLATSSRPCRPVPMPISCGTSFTTGTMTSR